MAETQVTEAMIKKAVKKRREYILANLETVSLKKCRQQLEEDMGLEQDALKPFKDLLSRLIDKVIASARPQEEAQREGPKEKSAGKGEKGKRAKGEAVPERKAEQAPAKASGPRQFSKRVLKLRNLCKEASITVGPSLYKIKDDDELAAALEQMLEKHGLSAGAGKDEVARVRRDLALARDLDGIDPSNILQEGGRRARRGAAAAPVNYRQLAASDSEEEEDEEEDGEDSSEAASGSEAESGAEEEEEEEEGEEVSHGKRRKQQASGAPAAKKHRPKAAGSRDEAGSDSGEEAGEAGQDGGSGPESEEAQAPSEKCSPDENKATANVRHASGGAGAKQHSAPAAKVSAAAVLDDGADDMQAAKKVRRVVTDWSDDDD